MMHKLTEDTIQKIENDFKVSNLYKIARDKNAFCIHVNSLVNIGLVELGYRDIALKNIESVLECPLFSRHDGLFYREINEKSEIIDRHFNSCKNALAVLSLSACGKIQQAENVIDAMFESPLFGKQLNLFNRDYNPLDKTTNPLVITQTNLWVVIALSKLQRISEAKKIMRALEKVCFDSEIGLFFSQDCERKVGNCDVSNKFIQGENVNYYSDDQGLAAIAYKVIGEHENAKNVLIQVLASNLYNAESGLFYRNINALEVNKTITSYKNGIMGTALGMLGFETELTKLQKSIVDVLYDTSEHLFNFSETDKTKIPDNSMLALLAINYHYLTHTIFS